MLERDVFPWLSTIFEGHYAFTQDRVLAHMASLIQDTFHGDKENTQKKVTSPHTYKHTHMYIRLSHE